MNEELFGGQITRIKNCVHAEYLLNNNEDFYDIGFRVMKNQESGCILPCHTLKYNGRIKLVYFTDGLVSLEQKLKEADAEQTKLMLSNLFDAIKEIEENGFLNVNCIETRLERIYVDNRTSAIKLIYLPINQPVGVRGSRDIESEIRASVAKVVCDACPEDYPRVQNVEDALRNEKLKTGTTVITLKAVDGSAKFVIDKDEYLIGKSVDRVDGVITGNPAISRVHCKMMRDNGEFYIVDMESSNGTFLNGKRLEPSERTRVEQGNQVRIANMEFVVWR